MVLVVRGDLPVEPPPERPRLTPGLAALLIELARRVSAKDVPGHDREAA